MEDTIRLDCRPDTEELLVTALELVLPAWLNCLPHGTGEGAVAIDIYLDEDEGARALEECLPEALALLVEAGEWAKAQNPRQALTARVRDIQRAMREREPREEEFHGYLPPEYEGVPLVERTLTNEAGTDYGTAYRRPRTGERGDVVLFQAEDCDCPACRGISDAWDQTRFE